mgnify:FL=1|jgi:hypothetical protein|tara:strand:+ start:467 stop:721 length:255 start_codon:yes stop_codon:yes gene_type:complete
MGRIFKTPSDNATEETLRAIHIANTVDTTYERAWGWVKTVLASLLTMLIVSGFEFYNPDISIYENSVDWFVEKVHEFLQWLKWW